MSYLRRVRLASKLLFQTCSGGSPTPVSTPPVVTPPIVLPPVVATRQNINLAVFNESTVVDDPTIKKMVDAFQRTLSGDFAPIWGLDARLEFFPKGAKPDPTFWQMGIFDTSDQAGALGYHDITPEGLPLSKTFAATDLQFGSSLSVTFSHEGWEILVDPDINLSVFVQSSDLSGLIYAYESADAVEDDQFGYMVDGVLISDFVTPAWFESFRTSGSFDFQKKVSKPFELLPGGYISVYQIPNSVGWTQQSKDEKAMRYMNRARLGSRRERRKTPRDQWVRSGQPRGK